MKVIQKPFNSQSGPLLEYSVASKIVSIACVFRLLITKKLKKRVQSDTLLRNSDNAGVGSGNDLSVDGFLVSKSIMIYSF